MVEHLCGRTAVAEPHCGKIPVTKPHCGACVRETNTKRLTGVGQDFDCDII